MGLASTVTFAAGQCMVPSPGLVISWVPPSVDTQEAFPGLLLLGPTWPHLAPSLLLVPTWNPPVSAFSTSLILSPNGSLHRVVLGGGHHALFILYSPAPCCGYAMRDR